MKLHASATIEATTGRKPPITGQVLPVLSTALLSPVEEREEVSLRDDLKESKSYNYSYWHRAGEDEGEYLGGYKFWFAWIGYRLVWLLVLLAALTIAFAIVNYVFTVVEYSDIFLGEAGFVERANESSHFSTYLGGPRRTGY